MQEPDLSTELLETAVNSFGSDPGTLVVKLCEELEKCVGKDIKSLIEVLFVSPEEMRTHVSLESFVKGKINLSPEVLILNLQQLEHCPVLELYQYLEGTLQLNEPLVLRGLVMKKRGYYFSIVRSGKIWNLNKLKHKSAHNRWSELLFECFELEIVPVLVVYERTYEAKINLNINEPLRMALECLLLQVSPVHCTEEINLTHNDRKQILKNR